MMDGLSEERVQEYLKHLGMSKPTELNREYLDALVSTHLERVPFENLDVHLDRRIAIDAETVFNKLIRRGRGGYCFELNPLFFRLLVSLGYKAQLHSARLRIGAPDNSTKRARMSHAVPIVELPNGDRCVADVGMGLIGLHKALPLKGDAAPFGVRVVDAAGRIEVAVPTISGSLKGLYMIEPYDLDWIDFSTLSWYSCTHPDSSMRRLLLAGRRTEGCWARLRNDTFIRWSPTKGIVEKKVMRDENDVLELLQTEFGLRLNLVDEVIPLKARLQKFLADVRPDENALTKKVVWPEG
ncbi:arylamine N-acetyltransferase-like [Amblyomma americanum]|uniref:arylamine N-acetyltransferase n=1 Tax=Amblyomma americanum TaxID=6943 RepID=A0AAQ4D6A5_AMBAM